MKRWMLVLLVAVLGLNAIGCHKNNDDDNHDASLKVKVDK